MPHFKEAANCHISQGNTILLWSHKWNDIPCIEVFPKFHSFATNDAISIKRIVFYSDLGELFHIPLSLQAYNQFEKLQTLLQHVQLSENKHIWSYS